MKLGILKVLIGSFMILSVCRVLYADLPVHCLKSQIVGDWNVHITPSSPKTRNEIYEHKCGHGLPSHETTAYKSIFPRERYTSVLTLSLKANDDAYLSSNGDNGMSNVGKWTMVYDEGFDIILGNQSFFAFNMYSPKTSRLNSYSRSGGNKKWDSKCYATLNGWYRNGDNWGCFYATKKNVNDPYQITNGEAEDKNIVLEGVIKSQDEYVKENREFESIGNLMSKIEQERDKEMVGLTDSNDNYINFVETKTHTNTKNKNKFKIKNKLRTKSMLTLNTSFKGHSEVVSRINEMNLGWKAYNYDKFSDLTLEQLNKFSGRNKDKLQSLFGYSDTTSSKNKAKKLKLKGKKYKKNNQDYFEAETNEISMTDPDYRDLPREHLKWKSYVRNVYSQGNCGSCYILSTVQMIKTRLEILYGVREDISVDHIINCSITNQGCDGGYSYLVSKFGADLEILPKSCEAPRINGKFQCQKRCEDSTQQRKSIKIKDYKFIGGSYGKSSEEAMMKDIMQNGPTVCSFSPGYAFNMYRSGVYNSISKKTWKMLGLSKPEWVKVEHSVLCVGWGIDDQTGFKYWLVLNSWGQEWGDRGFFKIRRGVDLEGIESIGESSIPYIEESE